MRYAKYIGRVGGLAVALGVGLSFGTAPGLPVAQASESTSESSSDTSTTDTQTNPLTTTGNLTVETAPNDSDVAAESGLGTGTDIGGDGDGDGDIDDADIGEIGIDDDIDATDEIDDIGEIGEGLDDQPAGEQDANANGAVDEPPLVDDVDDGVAGEPAGGETNGSDTGDVVDAPVTSNGSAADVKDDQKLGDSDGDPDLATTEFTAMTTFASDLAAAGGDGSAEVGSLDPETMPMTLNAVVAPPANPSPVAQVFRLFSGLLSLVGLAPSPTSPPAQSPLAWGLLAWVRRSFQDVLAGLLPGTLPQPVLTAEPVVGPVPGERPVAGNTPPVADDDSYTVAEDTTLKVSAGNGLLTGDTDANRNKLRVHSYTAPANGTVSVSANGALTYTPDADYHGTDTFTYTVTDGRGGYDVGTVTITVTPVNDAPVARNDSYTVAEDTTLNVPAASGVLAGDTDVDGDTLVVTGHTQPANGTVIVSSNGALSYTPDADFHGTDTFSYTISDGNGGTDSATVTITVTPVNDAPVARDDSYTVAEDTTLNVPAAGGVLAGDTDVDGDTLTVTGHTQPANGTVTVSANGALTYTPDADYHGTDTFSYTISDGNGGTDSATVTITVTPVNDAPVARDDSYTVRGGTSLLVSASNGVLAGDTDVDGDTLTVISHTQPANGTVTVSANGALSYTPNTGYDGIDTFTYTISDGNGGTDSATVTITVTPGVTAPVAGGDSFSTDEEVPVTRTLPGSGADGQTLTYEITVPPANGTISDFDPATGTYTYTPATDYYGTDTIRYTVTAGGLTSNEATVTITVNPVNDAPVAADDSITIDEDTPFTRTLPGTDVDGPTLTYEITKPPTNGTISDFDPATGTYTYTPDADYSGTDTIKFTVSDGFETSNEATVTITVTAVNDAPVIESVTSSEPDPETGAITYTVTVTDVDSPAEDFGMIVGMPANGTVSEAAMTAPGTFTFTYTPSVLARLLAGSTLAPDYDSFTIAVNDGELNATAPVTVEIYAGSLLTDASNKFVGFGPQGMAVHGNRLYVANAGSNGVAVIDTDTGQVLGTIATQTRPQRLVVSPDGTRLYVANNGSGTVSVFDTAEGTAISQVAVASPFGLALNGDGTRLYVTSNTSNKVTVFNTATGATVATITVGSAPTAVVTDGAQVYVANKNSGTVSVIDAATNDVVATWTVGSSPQGLALSSDGNTLYVTNTGSGTVSVIDTTTAATVATIAVGPSPNGIVLSPDGSVAYVNSANHTVAVIDTTTNTKVTGTIQAETGTLGQVAVSADGQHLYVSNSVGITIRTVSLTHLNPPPVTENPNTGAMFEDFNGPAGSLANPDMFSFLLSGGGAGKLQMNTTDPRNASLDGEGNLVITAYNEPYTYMGIPLYNYTSAYLTTQDKFEFTYGTLTARIKFPVAQGIHPAFWMLGSDVDTVGWPDNGEIDIFEIVNSPTYSGSGLHGPGNYGVTAPAAVDIDDDEFHEFWLKWEPDKITVGIDDQITAVWTPDDLPPGVPWTYNDRSMYVIMNIAIGGMGGPPDETTTFPAQMIVDWLKYEPLESDVAL
ncbi:Ig-like domain-containing protein [Mycolicibacterium sp. XJ1819]